MSFYNSPADMYAARAARFKRDGDRHWAKAKAGQGDHHYGKAKFCYTQSAANTEKAERAMANCSSFRKKP